MTKLTDKEIVRRVTALGHTYIDHFRTPNTNKLVVVYGCGTCHRESQAVIYTLKSPRCHHCKLMNFGWGDRKRKKQRRDFREHEQETNNKPSNRQGS